MEKTNTLTVKNFAQIKEGNVEFGDLTILVGPQASGKSLFLQLLKLLIDRYNIASVLKKHAYNWKKDENTFLEFFFGENTSGVWKEKTEVTFQDQPYSRMSFLPRQGVRDKAREEKLFYIPAQRVVTMAQGWPRNFNAFDVGDPYVLKSFSETLRVLNEKESRDNENVFPRTRRIKEPIRDMLDESIFYGASVAMDTSSKKKNFVLQVEKNKLPFMTWSAGQKEFMPLLLSLYYLIPSAKVATRNNIEWVVIEEPEMGLHPKAIQSLMVIFLELVKRGYKVIVSTHSPVLLELAWTINYIQAYKGNSEDLFHLFDLEHVQSLQSVFDTAINKKLFKTYYFERKKGGVHIKDISNLDAGSEDPTIANWGGLSEFAGRATDIVSRLVAHGKEK